MREEESPSFLRDISSHRTLSSGYFLTTPHGNWKAHTFGSSPAEASVGLGSFTPAVLPTPPTRSVLQMLRVSSSFDHKTSSGVLIRRLSLFRGASSAVFRTIPSEAFRVTPTTPVSVSSLSRRAEIRDFVCGVPCVLFSRYVTISVPRLRLRSRIRPPWDSAGRVTIFLVPSQHRILFRFCAGVFSSFSLLLSFPRFFLLRASRMLMSSLGTVLRFPLLLVLALL